MEVSRWRCYRSEIVGYMTRWIVQTPWGTVRLHHIQAPDPHEEYHDHPWSFVSVVLWGSYVENCPSRPVRVFVRPPWRFRWATVHVRGPLSVAFRRATDRHTISWISPGGVWTLVVTGPRVRSWGFHTSRGWVPWREHLRRTGWTQAGDDQRRDR